jgi:hypothetical protein
MRGRSTPAAPSAGLRGHATHTSPSGQEDRHGAPRLANDRARHQLRKTQDRVLHFFCGRRVVTTHATIRRFARVRDGRRGCGITNTGSPGFAEVRCILWLLGIYAAAVVWRRFDHARPRTTRAISPEPALCDTQRIRSPTIATPDAAELQGRGLKSPTAPSDAGLGIHPRPPRPTTQRRAVHRTEVH